MREAAPNPHQPELDRCVADPCYWINTYVKTFDPRAPEPVLPFNLFARQIEFIRWLQEREQAQESGLAEKSRDVGFTWLCCSYALHGWLFRKGFTAGFGSRKLELVDRIGDPACIFEKIRFALSHLPEWMLPAGFNERKHSGLAKLINPVNGATIVGEGGDQIGRGGRSSMYFVDEAAYLQHPRLADAALSANTNVRIWVSTPNGVGNSFYEKRTGGKLPVFTFHWKDDPRKDEAWYERQKNELDSVTVAQEIDIDYAASVEGIAIEAKWVRASVGLTSNPKFCAAFPDYHPTSRPVAGFDVAAGGDNRSVVTLRRGIQVADPILLTGNGTEQAHAALDACERVNASRLSYDVVGVGFALESAFASMERTHTCSVSAVQGGATPDEETRWPDGKTSKEKFRNRRTELWFKLAGRFEKTWEFIEQGIVHSAEDMISIPACHQLMLELSIPLKFRTETGKWALESKTQMAARGVKSPDHADSLAYTEDDSGGDWSALLEGSASGFRPAVARTEVASTEGDWSALGGVTNLGRGGNW